MHGSSHAIYEGHQSHDELCKWHTGSQAYYLIHMHALMNLCMNMQMKRVNKYAQFRYYFRVNQTETIMSLPLPQSDHPPLMDAIWEHKVPAIKVQVSHCSDRAEAHI